MTEQQAPFVEMRGISIEFPGVKALDDVDLTLRPGEIHALMGENGAGKSTLIKALTGVYRIDSGTISVAGHRRRFSGTADAQVAGISTVYQEVNLCPNLSIGENLMLGHEIRGRFGIDWRRTHRAATEQLERFGLGDLDPRAPLASISIAMQQLVAVSRAMGIDSRVLILDEPTSSLDAHEVEQLFAVMRQIRAEGVALLFVSHFLDQIYEITDRLTVLRNGRFIGEYPTADLGRTELISLMTGRHYAESGLTPPESGEPEVTDQVAPVYALRGVGRKGVLEPADVSLHPGEIVGFAGLLGSGRTELARLLYGADRADSGTRTVDGKEVDVPAPSAALARGIAYSTENRRDEGIIGDLSVRENIILALQARRGWLRPVSRTQADSLATRLMDALHVRPADADRPIKNLSGGNQQKVLLARWLAIEPRVLILDEPTRGIDVGAKAEIQQTVADLAAGGLSVVFISSELEEVVRLSNRIVVLKDRAVIETVTNGPTTTADTIVSIIADEGAAA